MMCILETGIPLTTKLASPAKLVQDFSVHMSGSVGLDLDQA